MAITTVAHPELARITVGVDTHGEVHVAHAKDGLGRRLATVSVPTTPQGYAGLLAWARGLGQVEAFGVEGTGSYGAGLARFLAAAGQVVLEVNRPDRSARRRHGKSDPLDAEAAVIALPVAEGPAHPYARAALTEELARVASARKGERNRRLWEAGRNLYNLVAGGALAERQVHQGLLDAAQRCGLLAEEPRQTRRTLASARQVGLAHPRHPPQRPTPDRTPSHASSPMRDGAELTQVRR